MSYSLSPSSSNKLVEKASLAIQPDRHLLDLPARIQAACRTIHHTLNQTVVGRLSSALPPQRKTPHLYALGISRFFRIYSTLETAWRNYLVLSAFDGGDHARYHALLSEVYIPALMMRSERLRSDLVNLKREWGEDLDEISLLEEDDENDSTFQGVITHITDTAHKTPYVLLTYSWIMYMALFNGGRWVRDRLLDAGAEYWINEHNANSNTDPALIGPMFLSFWYFDGTEDGEDIKGAFRKKFVHATRKHLTEAECEIMVQEAQALFRLLLDLVYEIDGVVEQQQQPNKSVKQTTSSHFRDETAPVFLPRGLGMAVVFISVILLAYTML